MATKHKWYAVGDKIVSRSGMKGTVKRVRKDVGMPYYTVEWENGAVGRHGLVTAQTFTKQAKKKEVRILGGTEAIAAEERKLDRMLTSPRSTGPSLQRQREKIIKTRFDQGY